MYQMPVRAIKRILLEENSRMLDHLNKLLWSDYVSYLRMITEDIINNLSTYEEIDDYIRQSRRMSLSDWIETL